MLLRAWVRQAAGGGKVGATPGPLSRGGGEARGLGCKAVTPARTVLSPWGIWQCLGTFLAVTLGDREYC